jgi:hypothetical protein
MPLALMRMLIDRESGITPSSADRAYMSGMDQIPWPCRTRLADGELQIERGVTESGRLQMPMRIEGRGELMLSTGTLMQRDRPYQLEIELARGKLNQVRNQLAEWQALGLVITPAIEAAVARALGEFTLAVSLPEDAKAAAARARVAIGLAVDAGEMLLDAYVEQATTLRLRQLGRLPTLQALHLGHRTLSQAALTQVTTAFNALVVSTVWREIEAQEGQYNWAIPDNQLEWCREHNVRAVSGPLLRLDSSALPDWLAMWEDDFDTFVSFVSDYVAKVVSRYKGKVALWQCAARINTPQVHKFHEEQVLQLAVRALEVTRQVDPDTPTMIRFDQPWGEYLRHGEVDLSPLHFADALVRSGLQLGGIGLEINVGYNPGGTTPRDRLDFSRMLDLWSCLGLPLHLMFTFPTSVQPDPKARMPGLPSEIDQIWTPDSQAAWIKRVLPLAFSKAFVGSVTWAQLSDAEWHDYAHGGLFDTGGAAKPAFLSLVNLRKKFLN